MPTVRDILAKKGSLSVSRPAFSSYIADPQQMRDNFAELFDLVQVGTHVFVRPATPG